MDQSWVRRRARFAKCQAMHPQQVTSSSLQGLFDINRASGRH